MNIDIHSYRIGSSRLNFAVVDLVGTIIIALVCAYYMKINPVLMVLFFLLLGILVHRALHVRTALDRLMFPN